jgi:hypothetical protein
MKAPLSKKSVHFGLSLILALFGPFILPPHVGGAYEPLVSLLFLSDVWRGEAEIAFYVIIGVERGSLSSHLLRQQTCGQP